MVFATEGFFEVAIESWPEWDISAKRVEIYKFTQRTQKTALSESCQMF